ncbi:hypothetical protein FA95DRAFT_1612878 [Auriscalpium vulgare]|uniref:Uncharacterized protein n=1 Tax=Auriscalpium vulgare TaxID=40419 RepID=A0ACB8R605_9AGAM|nr:hypothetical protein FA95DRAFT_1612878 [Auriscalpium vulgare]
MSSFAPTLLTKHLATVQALIKNLLIIAVDHCADYEKALWGAFPPLKMLVSIEAVYDTISAWVPLNLEPAAAALSLTAIPHTTPVAAPLSHHRQPPPRSAAAVTKLKGKGKAAHQSRRKAKAPSASLEPASAPTAPPSETSSPTLTDGPSFSIKTAKVPVADTFLGPHLQAFYDFGRADDEEWVVDAIVGHDWRGNAVMFHVRWALGDYTWEPIEHLDEVQALDQYLELQGVAEWRQLPRGSARDAATPKSRRRR